MASCSLTFATWSLGPHAYLVLAASMIPLFWIGAGCVFVGDVLVTRGDRWSLASALLDVVGAILCLVALFGAVFYLGMLAMIFALVYLG